MSSSRMTFILEGRDRLSRVMDEAGEASDKLASKLLQLGAVGGAPMGAAVVAGAGSMIAGFVAAGAAAGAFKAAVQPQLASVTAAAELYTQAQDAQAEGGKKAAAANKAYQDALEKLPPKTRETAKAFVGLKSDYAKWSDSLSSDTMPIFTKGLEGARKALPLLTPLVKTTAGALGDFMDSLDGGGLKGFINRLNQAAKKTLPDLLNTGRNVFAGLGGIISAFLPTSDKMTGGLEKGSEAFAKWGLGLKDSEGFERFMEIAGTGSDSLGNLALAALDLYDALRPIAGVSIEIAEGVAKFIRWLPPEVLATMAAGFLGVKVAMLGINVALGLMSANPLVLAAAAGALLGLALVTAYKKSETFRTVVTAAMQGTAQMVIGQVRVIVMAMSTIFDSTMGAIDSLLSGMAEATSMIPGMGDKMKDAAEKFHDFRDAGKSSFDGVLAKLDAYSAKAGGVPKVEFKASAAPLSREVVSAQRELDGLKQRRKTAVGADKTNLDAQVRAAQARLDALRQKRPAALKVSDQASGKLTFVQRMLNSLNGRVATTTVRTQYVKVESNASPTFRAHGGPVPGFAGGGMPSGLLNGPGTGTSDSIPMWWASTGEYIVNAKSTAKYRGLIEAINSDSLGGSGGGAGMSGAGRDVAKGLASGMSGSGSLVEGAARQMAQSVLVGIRDELQIASPSKRTKALAADAGKGLIVGLTGSRDKIKATAKDLAKDIWAAFSGSKDNRLVAYVNKQTSKLLDAAKQRDALTKKIATAKAFAESTRVGAKQSAELGGLFESEETVSAGGINARLQAKLAKMKQFSTFIGTLAKRGLNKTMLREILNMGPEQGYAYASALAGADKKTFASINRTQYAINESAEKLGRKGADALYDSGKNAGKGFLKGLEGQKKDIEKLMMSIAVGMQAAIKKALGIKSPSTVMAKLGKFTTQGLARGLVDAVPHLDKALDVVSGRVAGTQPVLGRPAMAGAGGGRVVNISVVVEQAMDPVAVGQELQRVLLQFGRAQGATVNLNRGG